VALSEGGFVNLFMLPIARIHDVAVIVFDEKRSRDFDVNILGLKVTAENFCAERDSWKLDLTAPDGTQAERFSFSDLGANPEPCTGLGDLAAGSHVAKA
jgi:catechol 2,3-dioxygenase-like lactoylglutathione lyase family enzyme